MRVPPDTLPRILRVLAWFSIALGILGGIGLVAASLDEREVRMGRVVSSALWVWGGYRTLRGHKDGVDSLLAAFVLPTFALLALPFVAAEQRTNIPGSLIGYAAFAALVSGYLVHCRRSLPWAETVEHEPGSYGDWLTNPNARQGAARWFAQRDAALEADAASPPDPVALVTALVDPEQDFELTRMRLQQLVEVSDDGCADALLAGLADPAIQEHEPALKLVVRLLPDPVPVAAAPALRACADQGEKPLDDVLEALAATGDPAHLDLLVPALGSTDTAREVAAGMAAAFAAGRATPEHVRDAVPALAALLDGPAYRGSTPAARALIALDRTAARERILAGIDVRDDGRLEALVELHESGADIPDAILARLWKRALAAANPSWIEALLTMFEPSEAELLEAIARLDGHERQYRAGRAASAALRALVDRKSPRARDALEAAIARDVEDLSDTAAGLLCRLHDLPESPYVDPTKAKSPAARHHHTLSLASSYARNGGIVHALECLDDDEAAVLEEGLHAVGPPEVEAIWIEAIRLLMRGPLPTSRDERQRLIATWHDASSSRLSELDSAFYEVDHRLDVQLCRYAIAHADEIREALHT